ncbi:tail fiber domain-containing protein [Citrobacter freundii]|nr:tail fiber domain-containing protein [Citrobacter freundii]WFW62548.1 tail fiber domain-containing protein [Citrobacter freundii]
MWITSANSIFGRYVSTNNPQEPKTSTPWTQYQSSGTSDLNFKEVTGDLDLNESLSNIEAMDFKTFYYLADEAKTTRRGVIAQEIEKIDPQYVHSAEQSGKMTLDLNPLVLDALAAIKALAKLNHDKDAEIASIRKELLDLKAAIG